MGLFKPSSLYKMSKSTHISGNVSICMLNIHDRLLKLSSDDHREIQSRHEKLGCQTLSSSVLQHVCNTRRVPGMFTSGWGDLRWSFLAC